MATNEIKFKSDVSVFGNFNADSFSISRLETANLPALTVDGAVAYDNTKQRLVVYDLANTEWKISNGANVITSSTAPVSPDEGDLWFDSSSAVLYIYYTDTNGVSQWITTSTAGYSFGSDGDGSGIVNSIIAGNGIIVDSNDPINPVVSVEGISTSGTAPTSPADGDLWFDSDNGLLYIYYAEDGGSSQWVTASPQGPKGDTGPAGEDGAIGATGPAGEFGDIASMSVIGNVTGSTATPSEVSLISETNTIAGNDNDTTIPTSAAVKDYVDGYVSDPDRLYNSTSHSTVSGTILQNTTGRPLLVMFNMYDISSAGYILGEISSDSGMSGNFRVTQDRWSAGNGGGSLTFAVPDNWYWRVVFSPTSPTEKYHSSFVL